MKIDAVTQRPTLMSDESVHVAANRRLRERLDEETAAAGLDLILPPRRYCTDNAAMVAGLAWHAMQAGDVAGLDLAARA